jgi:3-oxoacyl-[acyl-carrier-protein] synthase-3
MKNGNYVFGSKKLLLSKFYSKQVFCKIFNKTGISVVYKSSNKENATSLAIKSANKLAKKYKNKINGLIYVTQSPNETIPPSGAIIHKRLDLKSDCFVMDIIQGCSSLPYVLNTMIALKKNKQLDNCMLIFSETYRKYINNKKSSTFPLFSDAASSIYFEKNFPKIISSIYFTDGIGEDKLFLKNKKELYMNGSEVFNFTLKNVPIAVKKLLKEAKLKLNDIDKFIFHQASKIVLENIIHNLKLSKEKVYFNLSKRGNTVSNTLPIALIDLYKEKKIEGKKILIMGFGVGYSLSGGIYKF